MKLNQGAIDSNIEKLKSLSCYVKAQANLLFSVVCCLDSLESVCSQIPELTLISSSKYRLLLRENEQHVIGCIELEDVNSRLSITVKIYE